MRDHPPGRILRRFAGVASFRARGAVFQDNAQDYFFITRGTWRWEDIPDFVPGRAAYDNWLVDHSYRDQVESINVSRCVAAIHQTGSDGNGAGMQHTLPKRDWNFLAMRGYIGGYTHGHTSNCNIELQCPDCQGIQRERFSDPQRPGERGPPWTGVRYHGHLDPLDDTRWVCKSPGIRSRLPRPENECSSR